MQKAWRHVFSLLLMPMLVFVYFVLADGQQRFILNQLVSILSTAGISAFRAAVAYKEVTIFAAAVLVSVIAVIRNPNLSHR
jgi:hypothetical protein